MKSMLPVVEFFSTIVEPLFLLLLLIQIPSGWPEKCPSIIEIDEKCASKFLYFGRRDAILVVDDDSYERNCNAYEEGMECLGDYIETCLHGLPRMVAGSLYNTVRRQFQTRCEDQAVHQPFIQHSQCLRNETIREEFHKCGDRYFAMVARIQAIQDRDLYAPAACCLMLDFQHCVEVKNRELCQDQEDNGMFWTRTFDEMSGETRLFCLGYDTQDNCQTNFPPEIWQQVLEGLTNSIQDAENQTKAHRFRSLFFTNVDLANNLKLL